MVAAIGILLLAQPPGAALAQNLPPRAGLLNDYAHVIDGMSVFEIERMLQSLLEDTQAELVIVTLRGIRGLDANEVAERIREDWGIGGRDGEGYPAIVVLYAVQEGGFGISYNDVARPYLPHGALDDAFDRQARPGIEAGKAGEGLRALASALVRLLRA
jgi:uncharacterized membrane protein YgcG